MLYDYYERQLRRYENIIKRLITTKNTISNNLEESLTNMKDCIEIINHDIMPIIRDSRISTLQNIAYESIIDNNVNPRFKRVSSVMNQNTRRGGKQKGRKRQTSRYKK